MLRQICGRDIKHGSCYQQLLRLSTVEQVRVAARHASHIDPVGGKQGLLRSQSDTIAVSVVTGHVILACGLKDVPNRTVAVIDAISLFGTTGKDYRLMGGGQSGRSSCGPSSARGGKQQTNRPNVLPLRRSRTTAMVHSLRRNV